MLISTATSADESEREAKLALLPVGSYEQHGVHLPLSTDTLIACAIASELAEHYQEIMLLPPVTFSCSHEHSKFSGTVSISAVTLYSIINDIAVSLEQSGITKIVLINGHGGNYVLSNVVQEANIKSRRMSLYPRSLEWREARRHAGCETDNADDMHGGEAETSILLAKFPSVVGSPETRTDFIASDRPHLLTIGVDGYSPSGIIGRPSLATESKGHALLESFSAQFKDSLDILS